MKLRVHKFLPITKVEGPGTRACIWVQGCSIRCPGCAVPWTWKKSGGVVYDVEELAQKIIAGPKVQGVTFLGGEPFDQATPLVNLAQILRQNNLSIVTFTGYTQEDINSSAHHDWHKLMELTDLLIAGPYIQELNDLSRPWIGSLNQKYHFLSSRYRHLEKELLQIPNAIEVSIAPNGETFINGILQSEDFKKIITCIKQ